MTALPVQPPVRLLTIADYAALGEDDQCRWELQEGRLIMSPSPTPWHQLAGARLHTQIESQLPADLVAIPDVDVDLQLAPPDQPGSSRRPDLVVVDRAELDRVRAEGGLLRASNVRLVVETLSPGSRRTDYVVKRGEYADAGIVHYWIVSLDPPISLTAFHLGGELGYVDDGEATDTFTTLTPCPLTIDLRRLV